MAAWSPVVGDDDALLAERLRADDEEAFRLFAPARRDDDDEPRCRRRNPLPHAGSAAVPCERAGDRRSKG
jgi:hypothetical protein